MTAPLHERKATNPMSEQREVHRVLCEARNSATSDGWCRNFGGQPGSPGCVDNHIIRVAGKGDLYARTAEVFCDANNIEREYREATIDVGEWNDAPGRTKAEVLAAFDRAIAATAPAPDLSFLEDQRGVSDRPDVGATAPTEPVKAV